MQSKRLVKAIALGVAAFVSSAALYAQTVTLTGTVTDDKGEPVVGATVMVLGTLTGTQTNFEGNWELRVRNAETSSLFFSCLGYQNVEESIGTRTVINVVMPENAEALEETVIVGYGTQKKVNVTGSVTSVDFSEINKNRTITTAAAALTGLVPGLVIRQTTGQPGNESVSMWLRGNASITSGASSPLVIVDGVEWSLSNVNPADIENISVLKDAASTAIYGARAANGVILVTTKQGEESRPRISYSFTGIFQTPYCRKGLHWVSDYADYMELMNEAYENCDQSRQFSQTSIDTWRAAKENPNALSEHGLPNYMAYPNTDWFDEIYTTGFSQEHQVSISGGSKTVRYLVSASYMDNAGIGVHYTGMPNSGSQKATVRVNLDADVTKWFTVGTKFYGQFVALGTANLSGMYQYLNKASPGAYVGCPGAWGAVSNGAEDDNTTVHMMSSLDGSDGTQHTWRLNGTLYAKIRPYKGISIEASVNYAPTFRLNHTYTKENNKYDYTNNTWSTQSQLSAATVTDYTYRNYYANTEILARYNNTFKKIHELGVVLGYTTTDYLTWAYQIQKIGATDWSLNEGATFSDYNSSSYSSRSGWALRSYFARVNYVLKNRYLFEANLRADGSSVFGINSRWGYFPSFSAGWRIDQEPWMASASNWLSQLKVRASWGQTGNNMGIGNYDWQATYNSGYVQIDGGGATGLYITSMSNVDLKWETTSTTDVGIDAAFFNNRFTAELDYYYKKTKDILYTPSTYLTMGNFSSVPSNLGSLWNQGYEIALGWKDTAGKDFYYWVNANFSYNRNMVTSFKGKLVEGFNDDGDWETNFDDVAESWASPGYCLEGHPLGDQYIYKRYRGTGAGYSGGEVDVNAGPKNGMIRTEADMEWVRAMINAGYSFNGVRTIDKQNLWYGDFIYADRNGDGNYGNSYDRYWTNHTSRSPYNLGLSFGFNWKGLEFSMIWSGVFDYYVLWSDRGYNTAQAVLGWSISERIANDHYFYDPDNPSDPRTNLNGTYPRYYTTITTYNNNASDFNTYKADYFKLKNVTIAYSFPRKWMNKAFIQELKIYVTGENLCTITSYPGMDPEVGSTIAGYPLMRSYTVGAQITF